MGVFFLWGLVLVMFFWVACFAGHGDKRDGCDFALANCAGGVLFQNEEVLPPFGANGDDEPAAWRQLVDQGLGQVIRCGCYDDHIKGGVLRPALITVAGFYLNGVVAPLFQPGLSFFG